MSESTLLSIKKKPKNTVYSKNITILINLWEKILPFCRTQERSDKLEKSVKPLISQISIVHIVHII